MWEIFSQLVAQKGGTATEFSQETWSNDTGVRAPDRDGVCGPLTCLWLACQKKDGQDFVANPEREDFVRAVWGMANDMAAGHQGPDGEHFVVTFADHVLKDCGMKFDNSYTVDGANNFTTELKNHIAMLPAGYYVVLFRGHSSAFPRGPGGIAHCVGVDTHQHQFFDPSAGKADFEDLSTLCNFIKAWIDTGYRILADGECGVMVRRYV
ncbi:MAG TPA: hypothetical protein VMG12_38065 [Polyangiaceae bacterium]|nr:hypothetical protein [Polyangiaceae bacterium]